MSRHPGTLKAERMQRLIAAFKAYGAFQISYDKAEIIKSQLPTTLELQRATWAGNISANISDLRELGYCVKSVPLGVVNGSRRTAFYIAEPQMEMEFA